MKHSTGKPTVAQRRRLDALSRMPCVACAIEGVNQPSRTEIHHITDKGYRKHSGGHDATLPICGWHHRGEAYTSNQIMTMVYGPSLAVSKRNFVASYGTERELLERVNHDIEAVL